MTSEVQNVACAPVFPRREMLVFTGEKWSGREDSNLRPLPPEDNSPSRTPQFSVGFAWVTGAYACVCSRFLHGGGSISNLRALSLLWRGLLSLGAIGIVFNEIRGAVLAAPVIYGLWLSGGTLMAWWIAICSLGGIALSVIVPVVVWKRMRRNG